MSVYTPPGQGQSPTGYSPIDYRSEFEENYPSTAGPSYELPSNDDTLGGLARQLARLQATVLDLQSRLIAAEDVQGVQQLLNHFAALHNAVGTKSGLRNAWEELFTDDGVAVYPDGSHSGRHGKGEWAFGVGAHFERSQLMLGNFDIKLFDEGGTARVRSDYTVHWVSKDQSFSGQYSEGGFNHWVLRREHSGQWAVQGVSFTVVWTTGQHPNYEESKQAIEEDSAV